MKHIPLNFDAQVFWERHPKLRRFVHDNTPRFVLCMQCVGIVVAIATVFCLIAYFGTQYDKINDRRDSTHVAHQVEDEKPDEIRTTVYVRWLDNSVQKLEVKNVRPFTASIYEITTENGDKLYFGVNNVVVLERKKGNGSKIQIPVNNRIDGTR